MKVGDRVKAQYSDSAFEQGEKGKISGVYEENGKTYIEVEFDQKAPGNTSRFIQGRDRWINMKFKKVNE